MNTFLRIEFFSSALLNDKHLIVACLRAQITAGLLEGEVYVAEDVEGDPVALAVW